ncbi:uncharacterized protein LOC141839912 [Curcuma longa]|uniref:uncharacterized protein LOC141839912 n=1 Tax=Curcuma longa TaxID=136217 RepID=UPI003D9E183C
MEWPIKDGEMAGISHRMVPMNVINQQIVEKGDDLAVVLLLFHGIPELCYSWCSTRSLSLTTLCYHDLRGFEDSDVLADPSAYTMLYSIGGEVLTTNQEIKGCPLDFDGHALTVDLQVLDMVEFNIILGMDWLATYHAIVDCRARVVTFRPPDQSAWEFVGTQNDGLSLISTIQAQRMLDSGCRGYLLFLKQAEEVGFSYPSDVHIVREYQDVFPNKLPSLPPQRHAQFTIEVIPGTTPVSKASYRITPKELEELKI